jgi:hypothetical protein
MAPKDLGANAPSCSTGHAMILSAQAVPSAALLPSITALPSGWSIGGADITSGKVRLWLDSDRAGPQAITVTLTAACDTLGARQIPSGQPGTRRFDLPPSQAPEGAALRFYTFPGGCITYQFSNTFIFKPGASPRWPTPPPAPCRSSPGPRSSITSSAPKAWPCAGEAPHAHHEPSGRTNTRRTAPCRTLGQAPPVTAGRGCHGQMPAGHKSSSRTARADGRDAQNRKIRRKVHSIMVGLDSRKYSAGRLLSGRAVTYGDSRWSRPSREIRLTCIRR